MEFCTILYSLKSTQNVGMIVRSHAAFGGKEIIFTGQEQPWQFKKGTQNFSQKLEEKQDILHIADPIECLNYLRQNGYSPVAIEISENGVFISNFAFPQKTALIVGNEGSGIPADFLKSCDAVVTIPQYSQVGSLNVAVSASIAMHEAMRSQPPSKVIKDEFV